MKALSLVLIVVSLRLADAAHSAETSDGRPDMEFLRRFMAGEYDLIGRKPGATNAYTGRVVIKAEGEAVQVLRTINGETQKCAAKFETIVGPDRIPILRMRFVFDGVEYDASYQWKSDADNYPRLTGLLYRADRKIEAAGIEALFPVRK